MSEYSERTPDWVEALLTAAPVAAPDAFQQEVLTRTVAVLRQRRRARRLMQLTALAACYIAGLLTMRPVRPVVPSNPPPVVEPRMQPAAERSALALEWEAVDHPDQAGELYRAAGDSYLDDTDPRSAVRCYGNALNHATAGNLTIEPTDSWLLMAIKDARQKERHDASRVE